jgi:hypothetical protein
MEDLVLYYGNLVKKEKLQAIMDVKEKPPGKQMKQKEGVCEKTITSRFNNRIHFDQFGQKFGAGDTSGNLCLWRFDAHAHSNKPYYVSPLCNVLCMLCVRRIYLFVFIYLF